MKSRKKSTSLDPDIQMEKLGARIRSLRKAKGFTSAETFANEKGLSRALYGRYENGANIEFLTLVKLANSFDLTLKEFFSEGFD